MPQYLSLIHIWKPVVVHAIEAFEESPVIDEIILITDGSHIEYCEREIVKKYGFRKVSAVKAGGAERYLSVWNALCTLKEEETGDTAGRRQGYVFIHDGARPFVTPEIIERAYMAVERWDACVVGMPVKDTIKLVDEEKCITESPNRSMVWQAQTPQVFSVPLIVEAFQKQLKEDCSCVTDDAMVVEKQMGIRVHMVEGSYENIKITTPEDLSIAEIFYSDFLKKKCREKC